MSERRRAAIGMIREGEAKGGLFGAAEIGYGTVVMTVGEAFIDTATAVVAWDASAEHSKRVDGAECRIGQDRHVES